GWGRWGRERRRRGRWRWRSRAIPLEEATSWELRLVRIRPRREGKRDDHGEGSALAGFGLHPEVPAVVVDDAVGDGQPQAGTLAGGLGGEGGFEDVADVLRGDPGAGV